MDLGRLFNVTASALLVGFQAQENMRDATRCMGAMNLGDSFERALDSKYQDWTTAARDASAEASLVIRWDSSRGTELRSLLAEGYGTDASFFEGLIGERDRSIGALDACLRVVPKVGDYPLDEILATREAHVARRKELQKLRDRSIAEWTKMAGDTDCTEKYRSMAAVVDGLGAVATGDVVDKARQVLAALARCARGIFHQ